MNNTIGNRLKLFGLALLFQGASLSAEDSFLYKAGQTLNEWSAVLPHRSLGLDALLEPQHEKLAREVVEMIEVPCPVEFFRLLPSQEQTGTHCIGNHIYLSVEQIDRLLEINPDAARFVIAHELIHALRFHTLKNSAWGFVLTFGLVACYGWLSKGRSPIRTQLLASVLSMGYGFSLFSLYRSREIEADSEAVRRLGAKIGLERAIAGAEAYLTLDKEVHPSSFYQFLSTHPSLEDRLAAIRAVTLA